MDEHKSEDIRQIALANDWKCEVIPVIPDGEPNASDIEWNVYALRGKETIHLKYLGDRQQECTYTYGDYRRYPARRAGVINFLTGRPDPSKFRAVAKRRFETDPDFEGLEEYRSVPWQSDSPAIDIMLAVMKKTVTWVRKIDGGIVSADVLVDLNEPGSARHFKIYDSTHGRRLEWADMFGFHTVALEQIVSVS